MINGIMNINGGCFAETAATSEAASGARICHYYETRDDLLDTLARYFVAGLEKNELCVWVVFEPLTLSDVLEKLRNSCPRADEFIASGALRLADHDSGYLENGVFDLPRVMALWNEALSRAGPEGYSGIRLNGGEAWLTREDWTGFLEYEATLNRASAAVPMLLVCTYPLGNSTAADLAELAHTHQFTVARQNGGWKMAEMQELKRAKEALLDLSDTLERRVDERTLQLNEAIEGLRAEILEHRKSTESLRDSEERFRQLAEHIREVFWMSTPNLERALYVSPGYNEVWGVPEGEAERCLPTSPARIHPDDRARVAKVLAQTHSAEFEVEFRIVRPDGIERRILDRGFPIRDKSGTITRFAGIAHDVTAERTADINLREVTEELRALSARTILTREEEGTRIAREIHDELGTTLTGIKWGLECLQGEKPHAGGLEADVQLEALVRLASESIHIVRRIAEELRPSVLDNLGLLDALEWQAQKFQARTGIHCEFVCGTKPMAIGHDQATTVFRILQEAMTNVLRHSDATRVEITALAEPHEFVLTVRDNGRGIQPKEDRSRTRSLGVLGMKERAHLVGGTVVLSNAPNGGALLELRIPGEEGENP